MHSTGTAVASAAAFAVVFSRYFPHSCPAASDELAVECFTENWSGVGALCQENGENNQGGPDASDEDSDATDEAVKQDWSDAEDIVALETSDDESGTSYATSECGSQISPATSECESQISCATSESSDCDGTWGSDDEPGTRSLEARDPLRLPDVATAKPTVTAQSSLESNTGSDQAPACRPQPAQRPGTGRKRGTPAAVVRLKRSRKQTSLLEANRGSEQHLEAAVCLPNGRPPFGKCACGKILYFSHHEHDCPLRKRDDVPPTPRKPATNFCDVCSAPFQRKRDMCASHDLLGACSILGTLPCGVCEKSFSTHHGLLTHLKKVHTVRVRTSAAGTEPQPPENSKP